MPVIKDLILTALRINLKHTEASIADMNENISLLTDTASDYGDTLRAYANAMVEIRDYLQQEIARWSDPRTHTVDAPSTLHGTVWGNRA